MLYKCERGLLAVTLTASREQPFHARCSACIDPFQPQARLMRKGLPPSPFQEEAEAQRSQGHTEDMWELGFEPRPGSLPCTLLPLVKHHKT